MVQKFIGDLKAKQYETKIILGILFVIGLLFVPFILQTTIPFSVMIRDIYVYENTPRYIGIFSNIGIVLWGCSIAITVFMAYLSRQMNWDKGFRQFWILSALLMLFFIIDDSMMLHEDIFPSWGLPQWLVMSIYVGIVLGYLALTHQHILHRTNYFIIVIAMGLMASSIFVDIVRDLVTLDTSEISTASEITTDEIGDELEESELDSDVFTNFKWAAEDVPKLLGIIAFAFYFATTAFHYITSQLTTAPVNEPSTSTA